MATQTATKTSATKSAPKTKKKRADENILETIHANQEAAVDMTQKWVDSIGDIVPSLWNGHLSEGAPAIHEITDAAFEFTRKVLDAQIEFTKRLIDSFVDEVKKLN
jgi:hypothetical protein